MKENPLRKRLSTSVKCVGGWVTLADQFAAELMASRLPRAESVTLLGATHVVNIEAAEAFNAAVLRFLEKIRVEAA